MHKKYFSAHIVYTYTSKCIKNKVHKCWSDNHKYSLFQLNVTENHKYSMCSKVLKYFAAFINRLLVVVKFTDFVMRYFPGRVKTMTLYKQN